MPSFLIFSFPSSVDIKLHITSRRNRLSSVQSSMAAEFPPHIAVVPPKAGFHIMHIDPPIHFRQLNCRDHIQKMVGFRMEPAQFH